eukprot:4913503-Amphidinium_carterae.2
MQTAIARGKRLVTNADHATAKCSNRNIGACADVHSQELYLLLKLHPRQRNMDNSTRYFVHMKTPLAISHRALVRELL